MTIREASEYSRQVDTQRRGLSVSYLVRAVNKGTIRGRLVETPAINYWMIDKASLDAYLARDRKPGPKAGSKRQPKAEGDA